MTENTKLWNKRFQTKLLNGLFKIGCLLNTMLIVPQISNVTSETCNQSVKIKLTLRANTGGNGAAVLEQ